MNDRQKLTKLMIEADANAVQANKDERFDSAKQWRAVAAEYAKEIASLNARRVRELAGR